jgi:hypothetical protein
MIQYIITTIIGMAALIYVFRIVIRQFSKSETNPKCENCPIPDLKKTIKN